MAKIWINPAFKNKVKVKDEKEKKETKKTEKPKPHREKNKQKKQKEKKPPARVPDVDLETKFIQHLKDSQAVIEVKLLEGPTFTGKIKWIYQWMTALELEDNRAIVFTRLNLSHYKMKNSEFISEKEIEKMAPPEHIKSVDFILQEYKDNKTPLIFHIRDGLQLKGTLEWYEKLVYHLRSQDGKDEYSIPRDAIVYFEEANSNE